MFLLQNEDDKYGVIDKDGKTVVEFGEFSKDELLNASYCNSGITVVKQNGNKNDVYYYQTAKEVKKSFFEANKKIILFAGIGVAILLVILCVIIALKKKAAAKAEEQRQQEKRQQDAQRRKPVSPKFQQPTIQPEPQRREKPPVKKPNVTSGKGTSIHSAVKASASKPKKGYLEGVRGEYTGAVIPLEEGMKIRIGRSQENNDLILNSVKISRHHCIIDYDSKRDQYRVVDYSSNGVYLPDGTRLERKKQTWLNAGTTIIIGNEENVFKLGKSK